MLDPRRLRVFVEVLEQGSFSAAARSLACTQPAVSRQIAALEREAGVRLLERDARAVRLTQAGELVLEHARVILGRLATAEAELEALTSLEGGRLRLASFPSANVSLIPRVVTDFARHYPRVELTLAGDNPEHNLEALAAGELDLAIVTNWDIPVDGQDGFESVHLLDDELLLALPNRHPLATRKRIRLRELAEEIWIEGAHPDCLGPLNHFFQAAGFKPRVGFVCDDWTGKQGLVAAGVGLMLFPSLALPSVRGSLALRPLDGLPARKIYAVYSAGRYQPPALEPMLELLHSAADHHRRTVCHPPVAVS